MIPRIYHPDARSACDSITLGRDNFHYAKNVLRLVPGNLVIVFDGVGGEYACRLTTFFENTVDLVIEERTRTGDSSLQITLAQSLPKGQKMDLVVQKATELGVTRIIPFVSSRSIPKLDEDKAARRVGRWQRIAVEAARQCGRTIPPDVHTLVSFDVMLHTPLPGERRIILWEAEPERGLRNLLRDDQDTDEGFFIVIGPEGGLSWPEVDTARQAGFDTASLGQLILRTETAPLAVLAVLQYEKGGFGGSPG